MSSSTVKSSAQNHSVRSSAVPFQSDYDDQNDEVNAIITINKNQNVNESKSREVSPKLVVGGKKYGRRSRPQSAAPFESSQSDSEEDYEFAKVPTLGSKVKTSQKVSGIIATIVFVIHTRFLYAQLTLITFASRQFQFEVEKLTI